MEVYQKLLTKDEITARFARAVNAIMAKKLVPSKSALAEALDVKPAKFSEILNGRMKVGVDMIARMCDLFGVSPDWILMSRGDNVFRETPLPTYWIDDENLRTVPYNKDSFNQAQSDIEQLPPNETQSTLDTQLFEKIISQAEEIGRLKERIAQLEREKNDSPTSYQHLSRERSTTPVVL